MPRPVPSSPSRATATSGRPFPTTATAATPRRVRRRGRLPTRRRTASRAPSRSARRSRTGPGGRPLAPAASRADRSRAGRHGAGGRRRRRRRRGVSRCASAAASDGPTEDTEAPDVNAICRRVVASAAFASAHDDAPSDDPDAEDADEASLEPGTGPTSPSTGTRHATGRRRRRGSPRAREANRVRRRRAAAVPRATVRAGRRAGRQRRRPAARAARLRPVGRTRRRRVDGRGGRAAAAAAGARGGGGAGRRRTARRTRTTTSATRKRPPNRIPRRPRAYDQHLGGPPGPDWEQPRRHEAYPTIKARVGHAPGAADRGHGGRHRPARDRALLPARDAEHRRDRRSAGGERVTVGRGAGSRVAPTDASPRPTPQVYTIKKGDTLLKVARANGLTLEELLTANPTIKNPNKVSEGQQIVIPVPSASDERRRTPSAAPSQEALSRAAELRPRG